MPELRSGMVTFRLADIEPGVPWARIGEHVGQRSLRVTADTYSHVLSDEREPGYAELLGR